MRFAGYVITGYAVTGTLFATYWVLLQRRLRRGERSLPPEGGDR